MKRTILFVLFILSASIICAQPGAGYRPGYHFLHSDNLTADKIFYLLTVINHSPEVKKLLESDVVLGDFAKQRTTLLKHHITDTCKTVFSLLSGFKWTRIDSMRSERSDYTLIDRAIRKLYTAQSAPFDQMINRHLRPSGYYERYKNLSNEELLLKAWAQCETGMNYIVDQYGIGKKMRYPDVDSISYDVKGVGYKNLIKTMFSYLDERAGSTTLFYQPSLSIALQLMNINERDEPARYEPLERNMNKQAVQKAKATNWKQYAYSCILVPGEGPDLTTISIAPASRMRCDLAAERYKKGLSPFIIVSGGHVHPFHTPYCEAVEMKKYLMHTFQIPEAAIVIEPHARHTTTNFRNAERLMIRYGLPLNKPALCVSTKDQEDYIDNPQFDKRNLKELGYLPYQNKKRIADHEISFYPVMESLHMDPYDPIDP